MNEEWECRQCGWKGYEYQLAYKEVEGCVGDNKLEICPKCRSEKVFRI